ncbi:MAG: Fe-S cluster assembly protein SufD [Bacteroidota bacterium]
METINNIISGFDNFELKSDALADLRSKAIDSFLKNGFPTTRHEEWKYTSVKDIAEKINLATKRASAGLLKESAVNELMIAGKDVTLLVFENGLFQESLSSPLPSDYAIKNLASVRLDAAVKQYLGKIAQLENESFVALNTAFVNDGVFIHVPAKKIVDKPVHILYVNSDKEPAITRNLIIAEPESSLQIFESYHSLDRACEGITTNVTEVVVKRNGNVTWVKAQLENELTSQISFTQVEQEQDSRFSSTVVTTGGHLVRNNLHIRLNGTNCNSYMYGLYLLSGEQLCDNHTLVDHAMPHCESNELYKGVLGGKSTGVFNGKIFVRQDAQKTNAYQSNKNILLSDDAQMNTKPQLEIFADDVKCSHGTTTGQLDDEALFYLRARGIGEQSARTLLNIAFAADVLDHIEMETLKQNLQSIAEEKLMHS